MRGSVVRPHLGPPFKNKVEPATLFWKRLHKVRFLSDFGGSKRAFFRFRYLRIAKSLNFGAQASGGNLECHDRFVPKGKRAKDYLGVLARRNPWSSALRYGKSPLRLAERKRWGKDLGSQFQAHPRNTRELPKSGPGGSTACSG